MNSPRIHQTAILLRIQLINGKTTEVEIYGECNVKIGDPINITTENGQLVSGIVLQILAIAVQNLH